MNRKTEKLVAEFEHFIRLGNRGPNTWAYIARVDKALYRFFDFFEKAKTPGDVVLEDVPKFVAAQGKRAERDLDMVKSFYNWLRQVKGMNIINPAAPLRKDYWREKALKVAEVRPDLVMQDR